MVIPIFEGHYGKIGSSLFVMNIDYVLTVILSARLFNLAKPFVLGNRNNVLS